MQDKGHMVVIKTMDAWVKQARDALDTLREKNGGNELVTVRAGYDIDRTAFCLLIEAMYALAPHTGLMPDQELQRLADLRPVDEILW